MKNRFHQGKEWDFELLSPLTSCAYVAVALARHEKSRRDIAHASRRCHWLALHVETEEEDSIENAHARDLSQRYCCTILHSDGHSTDCDVLACESES